MTFLLIFITGALTTIAGIAILNAFLFPRLRYQQPASTPSISILIPARNEAAVIGTTLQSLLAQDYPNFTVTLLDDNSTDGTGEIARSLDDPRLKVINGKPLPDGWLGKNWACHQMAQTAEGDYLLFTDADVRWSPGALAGLVAESLHTRADLLTIWPSQRTVTLGERLVVPMMALAIIGYLPIVGTHYTQSPMFGAACGQCMLWRRETYQQSGGHAAVADNVLEDVTLARIVKQRGGQLRMADGAGLIVCRMYDGWSAVRDGYAKNILAGYGSSIPLLLLSAVFHWLIFILPWVLLLFSEYRLWAALLVGLGIGIRMLTAAVTRQRLLDGMLMPLSVVLMTVIAFRSIYWQLRYGGPNWKGRVIRRKTA